MFSLWIRKREPYCVTCGATSRLQCSHLIRRGKMSLRWDPLNCHTQCASCNFKHNHYPEVYTQWFLAQYGMGDYDYLIEKSKELPRFKSKDLEELLAYWKAKLDS